MTNELRKFLLAHSKELKLSKIEEVTRIPVGTLSMILNDYPHRSLSDDQEKAVNVYLQHLRYDVDKYLKKNFAV